MGRPPKKSQQAKTGKTVEHVSEADLHNLLSMLGRANRKENREMAARPATIGKAADSPAAPDSGTDNFSNDQFREWLTRERYVYAGEIGVGGMSRVFRAADLHLCRPVAMKILPEGSRPLDVCRFIHEAQVTSQLQHPNIVPIYDCGIDPLSNQPFFTMQMVERGHTFLDIIIGLRKRNAVIARKFGKLSERISAFLKVGDALAYAHSRGVVHQDVKPANILVGEHGEVYLIDWGIAKVEEEKPSSDPDTGRIRFPK